MEILCDIIVTDPSFSRVLATQTPLGWLLPAISAREEARVACDALALLRRVNAEGVFVYRSWLPADAGQRSEARRYCLVVVSLEPVTGIAKPVEWIPLETILHMRAAFPSQFLSLRTCLDRARQPSAPFDTPLAIEESERWIDGALEQHARIRCGPIELIRGERFYRVAKIETNRGAVFFKAGDVSIAEESHITSLVAECAPGCAASTVALDPRGWWLMEGLTGRSFAEAGDKRDVLRALDMLASIQTKLACDPRTERTLATTVGLADLHAAVASTLQELTHDIDMHSAAEVARTCDRLAATLASCEPLPLTWVHSDLAPANVLVSNRQPAIIDLNASMRSLPMLPLWRFLNGLKQRGIIDDRDWPICCEAYEKPWCDAGFNFVRRVWPVLREFGILLRIWIYRERARLITLYEPNTYAAVTQREILRQLVSALAVGKAAPTSS